MLERWRHRVVQQCVPREIWKDGIQAAVDALRTAVPSDVREETSCKSPVFILSAGWRSGSTLLQRLVCSDGRALIWGEPFGDRVPVCRLASTLAHLHSGDPHLRYTIETLSGDPSLQWVANLNPGVSPLRRAHLSFFEQLLAKPAEASGARQWGAKWVRLTAAHAAYLNWLYPTAKVLFLVRHPLEAYLSYKRKGWYTLRPHHQVNGVVRFMAHWTYLAESFIDRAPSAAGFLVRYEDLIDESSPTREALEDYLGVPLRDETLERKIGARNKQQLRLSLFDRATCGAIAGPTLRRFGYSMSGRVKDVVELSDFRGPGLQALHAESA